MSHGGSEKGTGTFDMLDIREETMDRRPQGCTRTSTKTQP